MSDKFHFLGIRLNVISLEQIQLILEENLQSKKKMTICNINVHAVNHADRNKEFYDALQGADLVICDSDVIRLLSDYLFHKKIEKLTGSRWVIDFLKSHQKPLRIFLLGDETQVLPKSKDYLQHINPNLAVETHCGFFDKNKTTEVLNLISNFSPDILLVGMGMPKQEIFIHHHFDRFPNCVIIPVGGAFRYWAGVYKQAPKWMLALNLEWLHRIYQEPIRLGVRYTKDCLRFISVSAKYLLG